MYNRYKGNTGRVVRMEEPRCATAITRDGPRSPCDEDPRCGASNTPPRRPSGPGGIFGGLGGILGGLGGKLDPSRLETEDLILMLILFLMYRESGDVELLIALGALLFL